MCSAQAGPAAKLRPSLRDVAKAAGVTAAAVSYVVNGRTDQVGAETLVRVLEAIKVLGYRPQRRGLSLKLNREFAIGLMILDPNPHFLADPFTTQIAAGLSNALIDPGYGLMVTGARSLEDLERILKRSINVDALVVSMSGAPGVRVSAYKLVQEMAIPAVILQDDVPMDFPDACAISQADFWAGATLASHLVQRGAKRFLFVAPDRVWPAIERRKRGIKSVLKGKFPLELLVCDEQDYLATLKTMEDYLTAGTFADAIIGGNDQIAIAALKALDRFGLKTRTDVKLAGFNNFAFRNYTTPLLTSVTSAAYQIGRQAAEAVLSRLDTGTFPQKSIELPVSLALGDTT